MRNWIAVRKRAVRYGNTDTSSEIRSDVLAEFERQHEKFAVGRGECEPSLVEIYHCGTGCPELVHHLIKLVDNPLRCRVGWIESLYSCSGQSKSRPSEAMGIEELSVWNISWARSAGALPAERNAVGCWIASIKGPALDDAKRCGSVCHCPGVRSDPYPAYEKSAPRRRG